MCIIWKYYKQLSCRQNEKTSYKNAPLMGLTFSLKKLQLCSNAFDIFVLNGLIKIEHVFDAKFKNY